MPFSDRNRFCKNRLPECRLWKIWKVLKCGAGEGRRRSVGPIKWEWRVKEQRNILLEISKRKANWIGQILGRNCLLRPVIEGKIKGGTEVTGWRGRRRRKLLDGLKERRGSSHLKEEALDRSIWRAGFGRGFGPVVRQTAKWMYWFRLVVHCGSPLERMQVYWRLCH